MEPIDLSPKSDFFIATDTLQTAKELQTNLSTMDANLQQQFAVEAIEILGDPRQLQGSNRILVHTLGAMVLYQGVDAISSDEELYHRTYFADAIMRSNFSRFAFIQFGSLSSLCLRLCETQVLASSSNPEFVGEKIRSGVFVPVHAVESLLAA